MKKKILAVLLLAVALTAGLPGAPASADTAPVTPARWNPCAGVIHWAFDAGTTRRQEKVADVVEATMREIAGLTGLPVAAAGPSDTVEVRIAWGGASDPLLAGAVAYTQNGFAGPWIASSRVVVGKEVRRMRPRVVRSIIRHEIGHVIGLGHSSDVTSMMHPTAPVMAWNADDLTGLRLLGAASGCTFGVAEPAPAPGGLGAGGIRP